MPTISAKVSKKELDAITEYANACGETVSTLIRKAMISDAIFRNFYGDADDYNFGISVPDHVSSEEEDKLVLETYNKIRRIIGLKEYGYI